MLPCLFSLLFLLLTTKWRCSVKNLIPSVDATSDDSLFAKYKVRFQFNDKLCGGVPKSEKAIEGWIRTNVQDQSKLEQMINDTKESIDTSNLTDADIDDLAKSAWNGFKSDKNGLYIEGRQIKAMFKETANVIKNVLNVSAFKARVAERVFVIEDKVRILAVYKKTEDSGHMDYISGIDSKDHYNYIAEPSGSYEGMVHAMTAMGKISALKRVDYVDRPVIEFTLSVLKEKLVTKDKKKRLDVPTYLMHLITHAQQNGLGAERSQGNGRFKCTFLGEVETA